jgi:acyl-CoA thioester hydrolase
MKLMADLLLTYRGLVYPWQCDHMGHLNVAFYTAKFDEATWQMFGAIGITPEYIRRQLHGVAATRQNLTYRRELQPGALVTIHTAILEMQRRKIRFYHEMRDDADGALAATATITGVFLDMVTRKACPFPDEIVQAAAPLMVPIHPVL